MLFFDSWNCFWKAKPPSLQHTGLSPHKNNFKGKAKRFSRTIIPMWLSCGQLGIRHEAERGKTMGVMWYSEMPANVWPSSQRRSLYIQLSAACLREFFEKASQKKLKKQKLVHTGQMTAPQESAWLSPYCAWWSDSKITDLKTKSDYSTCFFFSGSLTAYGGLGDTSPQSISHHCQSHIDINFPYSSEIAKTMSGACVPPAVRLQNSIRNGSCIFYRCCSLLPLLCELVLFSLKGSRIGLQQQGPQQH